MGLLSNLKEWTDSHNPKWLALFRVALGATLLLRGVAFLNDPLKLATLISDNGLGNYQDLLTNTIPWIHIGGGFLIIVGLFTRFASFIQIPVILGAIIFVTSKRGLFKAETDFSLSIIILLLAIVFMVEGSGPLSLANYFKEEQEYEKAEEEAEATTE
jgi:putative oxidoreductase